MHGLFPMQDVSYNHDVDFLKEAHNPLVATSYEKILNNISSKNNQCHTGPVIQVPHNMDIMMHTRNCKRVHDHLNKDRFDMVRLDKMLEEYFGQQNVADTKLILEKYFGQPVKNVRDYFEMLDARIAEMKHAGGHPDLPNMQRQECFILANNFISDDERPSQTYLSRMVVPFSQVLTAKVFEE